MVNVIEQNLQLLCINVFRHLEIGDVIVNYFVDGLDKFFSDESLKNIL